MNVKDSFTAVLICDSYSLDTVQHINAFYIQYRTTRY